MTNEFSVLDELQTTFCNGFYLRSSKGYSGEYVAWCKREMFTGSDPIDESGEVWFEFGPTREDAIAALWRSMDGGSAKVGGPAFYDTPADNKYLCRFCGQRIAVTKAKPRHYMRPKYFVAHNRKTGEPCRGSNNSTVQPKAL